MEAVLYSGPNNESEQELVRILEQANIVVNNRQITDLNDVNLQLVKDIISKNLIGNEIVVIVAKNT